MRALIIDDERLARAELTNLLQKFEEIEIVGEAKNGTEAIQLIAELEPDVIFLDINMPGMTGFELIKKLETIPKVIFVTAYDEYAIQAFEVNALDYVLKPVDPERLEEAVNKLNIEEEEYESGLSIATRKERKLTAEDRVFIKDGEKCFFIELSKIRMFESKGNYVKVYFDDNKPMILRSLNGLEDRLDSESFFRANRKFIINLNWITHIENWFNGGLQVTLQENEKIEISRRQAIKFKDYLSI